MNFKVTVKGDKLFLGFHFWVLKSSAASRLFKHKLPSTDWKILHLCPTADIQNLSPHPHPPIWFHNTGSQFGHFLFYTCETWEQEKKKGICSFCLQFTFRTSLILAQCLLRRFPAAWMNSPSPPLTPCSPARPPTPTLSLSPSDCPTFGGGPGRRQVILCPEYFIALQ